MRNLYLSATRNFNTKSNHTAPEYAENHLDVKITFPQGISQVREISVRIYSSDYHFMGTGCVTNNPNKNLRKVCFDIASFECWEEQELNVYVFVNGRARWQCRLFLLEGLEGYGDKEALRAIEENSIENFFIEKLSMASWWNRIYMNQFKTPSIPDLIEKLFVINQAVENRDNTELPALLVTGEDEHCRLKEFTSEIIGKCISNDDASNIVQLFLEEITNSLCDWSRLAAKIEQAKAVILEIPQLADNVQVVNLVNFFISSVIKHRIFPHTAWIIYGIEKNLEAIGALKETFDDSHIIHLSSLGTPDNLNNTLNRCDDENKCNEVCEAEKKLEEMIGLRRLKEDMKDARIMSLFNKQRADMSLQADRKCINHMLFLGNPGTGKTTVAKLVGQIYHSMGLLSRGHTVETNRAKLVGEYIGMTEQKTLDAVEEARGGVLFIDEAYTLVQSNDPGSRDFGKEVINALLTVLSEPNPDIIIIMAGYEDKMNSMLKTNPGLKDRFPLTFHFEDYTADELMEIACQTLRSNNYNLTDAAYHQLYALIEKTVANRDNYFGNGRWVNNFINQGIIKSMARRVMLAQQPTLDAETLCNIEEADIIDADLHYLELKCNKKLQSRPIGFRA